MPEPADDIILNKLHEWRRLYGCGPFPVGHLRKACGLDKAAFDAACLRLAEQEKIHLIRNDRGEFQWASFGKITTMRREWRRFRPGGRMRLSMR